MFVLCWVSESFGGRRVRRSLAEREEGRGEGRGEERRKGRTGK